MSRGSGDRSIGWIDSIHSLHHSVRPIFDIIVPGKVWIVQLTHVCRLLKRRWSRQRLLETCFAHEPRLHFRNWFHSFKADVYEGRWGSIVQAVGQLLPLMRALRNGWSLRRFGHGKAAGEMHEANTDKKVKLEIVDEAIRSDLFWGYLIMVDTFLELFEKLVAWAEGCPCHWVDTPFEGVARWIRRARRTARSSPRSCPLAGCHAWELAAGFLTQFVDQLLGIANASLLLIPEVLEISPTARGTVIEEFARARRHVVFILQVKTGHWRQLPWVLFGLAHPVRAIALECLQRGLLLYASAGDEARHHWLVACLCAAGTLGYEQAVLFIQGEDLSTLAFLESCAARMFFAFVVERWIESRHAISQRFFRHAPNASALHLAYHHTVGPVSEIVLDTSGGVSNDMRALVGHCASTRTARQALAATGLLHHPGVKAALGPGRINQKTRALNRELRSDMVEILFHVDGRTLHQPLPGMHAFRPPPPPPPAPPGPPSPPEDLAEGVSGEVTPGMEGDESPPPPAADPPPPSPAPPMAPSSSSVALAVPAPEAAAEAPAPEPEAALAPQWLVSQGVTHDALLCKYAMQHLKSLEVGPLVVFSFGPKMSMAHDFFLSYVSKVADPEPVGPVPPALRTSLQEFQFEPEQFDEVSRGGGQEQDYDLGVLFFQLGSPNPCNVVLPLMAPKARKPSDAASEVLNINVMPVAELNNNLKLIRVSLEGLDGRGICDSQILTSNLFSIDDLRTFRSWTMSGTDMLSFQGVSLPDHLARVSYPFLLEIVEARRIRGAEFIITAAATSDFALKRETALYLRDAGRLRCSTVSDLEVTCAFTDLGVSSLRLTRSLQRGTYALRKPRLGIAFASMTRFELMLSLTQAGWSCIVVDNPKRKDLVPYTLEGPRHWYAKSEQKELSFHYLVALLKAADHKLPVEPFRADAYYLQIISGKPWVKRGARKRLFSFAIEGAQPLPALPPPPEESESEEEDEGDEPPPVLETSGSGSDQSVESLEGALTRILDEDHRRRGGSAMAETSFIWRELFKFTEIYHRRTHVCVGYEVLCYVHQPRGCCRRRRHFRPYGGRDPTERMLKEWFGGSHLHLLDVYVPVCGPFWDSFGIVLVSFGLFLELCIYLFCFLDVQGLKS